MQCESDPGAQQVQTDKAERAWALRDARADLLLTGQRKRRARMTPTRLASERADLPFQQVLRQAFPGVLLEPDVCALRALPEVRAMSSH